MERDIVEDGDENYHECNDGYPVMYIKKLGEMA